jgi:hypothetical protein
VIRVLAVAALAVFLCSPVLAADKPALPSTIDTGCLDGATPGQCKSVESMSRAKAQELVDADLVSEKRLRYCASYADYARAGFIGLENCLATEIGKDRLYSLFKQQDLRISSACGGPYPADDYKASFNSKDCLEAERHSEDYALPELGRASSDVIAYCGAQASARAADSFFENLTSCLVHRNAGREWQFDASGKQVSTAAAIR